MGRDRVSYYDTEIAQMSSATVAAPPEGTAWKPGRSGNTVSWDGSAVVKRHASGRAGCLRELGALARVGHLPVPRVLPGSRPDALRMSYVPGLLASEAIEAGLASAALRAMGEALRDLQLTTIRQFGGVEPDVVLVHGDFAPYNVILSEDGTEVRAILDWEEAFLGDPLVDLAWCDAQFRRLFPRHAYALSHLFTGFGRTADRVVLEAAVATRMAELSYGMPASGFAAAGYRARAFEDRREAAAYIAALSRAALAPGRAGPGAPAEIWWALSVEPGPTVIMNDSAAVVSDRVFKTAGQLQPVDELPGEARLAFLAGHVPPLGLEDVLAMA